MDFKTGMLVMLVGLIVIGTMVSEVSAYAYTSGTASVSQYCENWGWYTHTYYNVQDADLMCASIDVEKEVHTQICPSGNPPSTWSGSEYAYAKWEDSGGVISDRDLESSLQPSGVGSYAYACYGYVYANAYSW
ncbi:MAG: hypothetical protein CVT89_02670 [Candidatus Altiarchaeales archaeon HGW-Altiarchaeales-2]|nr:MAG: hypothetical protein CVT89_02670 [Candidatus Altiarchaeales archaeon HGW-Altiarchaeales-2]